MRRHRWGFTDGANSNPILRSYDTEACRTRPIEAAPDQMAERHVLETDANRFEDRDAAPVSIRDRRMRDDRAQFLDPLPIEQAR